jgi:hypothetical protein
MWPRQGATRYISGDSIDTIITHFGRLGIMPNRYMPAYQLAVACLDQCVHCPSTRLTGLPVQRVPGAHRIVEAQGAS